MQLAKVMRPTCVGGLLYVFLLVRHFPFPDSSLQDAESCGVFSTGILQLLRFRQFLVGREKHKKLTPNTSSAFLELLICLSDIFLFAI